MLLKIKEVSAELSLAVKTVRRWIIEGKIRGVKLGRHWRIDSDDLAVFIARRRT
jgi:excisionase family DNA binding protein